MKKLCVVFPGTRYSVDRSILYYPSRIIQNSGYEMIYLHYDMHKESPDQEFELSYKHGKEVVDERLKDVDFSKYEKIIFLAKSLGTLLSSEEKEKIGRKDIVTIAITPLEGCLKYLNSKDLIICGLNDQFLPDAKNKLSNFPNSYIFPNLSHSLEAQFNYHLTLQTVENVAGIVEAYVNSLEL